MNNDNENFNTNSVPVPPPTPVNEDLNNLPPTSQPQAGVNNSNYYYTATSQPQEPSYGTNDNMAYVNPEPSVQTTQQPQYQTVATQVPTYSDSIPETSYNTYDDNSSRKKKFIILGIVLLALALILIPLIIFFAMRNMNNNNAEQQQEESVQQVAQEINLDEQNGDLEITKPGDYVLRGNLDGAVNVNAEDAVSLDLNSAQIKSNGTPAINNRGTGDLNINLDDNSKNVISASYTEASDSGAAIYSAGNVNVNGNGGLEVTANGVDGINSANNITINSGDVSVYSDKNAISSGAAVKFNGGNVALEGKDHAVKTNTGYTVNGGKLVALSVNNLENPNSDSSQQNLVFDFDKPIAAGELVSIVNKDNRSEISFKAKSDFDKAVISTSNLTAGEHSVYQGGDNSGATSSNGIYSPGSFSGGTPVKIKDSDKFNVNETGTTEASNSTVKKDETKASDNTSSSSSSSNSNSNSSSGSNSGSGTSTNGQGKSQSESDTPRSGIPPKRQR